MKFAVSGGSEDDFRTKVFSKHFRSYKEALRAGNTGMPFHDYPSFQDWLFSNALWTIVQTGVGALVIAAATALGSKLGFNRDWRPTLWLAAAVFVVSIVVLAAVQPTKYSADLEPRILATGYGGQVNGQDNKQTLVFADIRNAGTQASSVFNLEVDVIVNSVVHRGKLTNFPNTISFDVNGKTITYYNRDALYNKISHKIDVGDNISGVIMCIFPDLNDKNLTYGDTTIRLNVFDVKQRKTYVDQKLGASNQGEMGIFPGMNPELH